MRQFLGESVILTAASLPIALGLSWISLPTVNEFVHKDLSFGAEPILILLLPAAALIVGLLAGWYPAVFLSSVQPVSVLKGSFTPGSREAWMRKSLVIFQFAASTALIISTTVIYQQTEFMQGRDLGWNKDYLINTPLFFADLSLTKHRERVKDAFLRHPNVLKITAVWPPPGRGGERHVVYPEGEVEGDWEMQIIGIDEDFLDTYEVELVAGRNIDLSTGTDSTQAYILNEAAVKALGWKEPLGKSFAWRQNKGTVIGVVKDFHTKSLHSPIEPVVLFHWIHPTLSIRIRPVEIQETLAFLEKTWKQFIPERPFNYQFQDENMAGRYWQETRQSTIYGTLSLLAIFVACLGLFGLAAFTTERRRKEISIRKSLGASQSTLFLLLSKDLAQSVALSMAIAWPVTYYLMASWLEKFAFRIDLGPGVFLFGGAVGLAIALVTVSWQTIRAATRNPVEVLRHE
jgi:putative ABC transport system permease protein